MRHQAIVLLMILVSSASISALDDSYTKAVKSSVKEYVAARLNELDDEIMNCVRLDQVLRETDDGSAFLSLEWPPGTRYKIILAHFNSHVEFLRYLQDALINCELPGLLKMWQARDQITMFGQNAGDE